MGKYIPDVFHSDISNDTDVDGFAKTKSERQPARDLNRNLRCTYCTKAKVIYKRYCEAVVASDDYNNDIALVLDPMVAYLCPYGQGYHKGHNRRLAELESDWALTCSWARTSLYKLRSSIDEHSELFQDIRPDGRERRYV